MNVSELGMNGDPDDYDADNTECLTNGPVNGDENNLCIASGGGARPKNKHLINNLANGISNHIADGAVAVNNNLPLPIHSENEATSSKTVVSEETSVNKVLNGLNSNPVSGPMTISVEPYLSGVNANNTGPACSYKLQNGTTNGAIRRPDRNGVVNKRWNDDGSSSDTANEGEDVLSSDECCFYTYKGDKLADLPSSFFRLGVMGNGDQAGGENSAAANVSGANGNAEVNENARHSGSSSPEMDFLEMDFDPGHSCDQNSDEDSEICELREEEPNCCNETSAPDPVSEENTDSVENDGVAEEDQHSCDENECVTTSESGAAALPIASVTPKDDLVSESQNVTSPQSIQPTIQPLTLPRSRSIEAFPSTSAASAESWLTRDSRGHHCGGADLCSPGSAEGSSIEGASENGSLWPESHLRLQGDPLSEPRKHTTHSPAYHSASAKRQLSVGSETEESCSLKKCDNKSISERIMIWSETEALAKNVAQIGTSQCGATAVINVLVAFNIPYTLERVKEIVRTRLRAESAPLPEYLLSRSQAGVTHEDIVRGIHEASNGFVYARFIHMYPERAPLLTKWLANWMRKGAIPVLTLNLQKGVAPGCIIPDAWHHQMVFGVSPRGVYLTNPVECVSEDALWPQLCSPSVLLVRRNDILARWDEVTDLSTILENSDPRWKEMNILGQVVNIIRESSPSRSQIQGRVVTTHITIPASYSSGVTLAISRESPYYEELKNSPSSYFYV